MMTATYMTLLVFWVLFNISATVGSFPLSAYRASQGRFIWAGFYAGVGVFFAALTVHQALG